MNRPPLSPHTPRVYYRNRAKRRLCIDYIMGRPCTFGKACKCAHGPAELGMPVFVIKDPLEQSKFAAESCIASLEI